MTTRIVAIRSIGTTARTITIGGGSGLGARTIEPRIDRIAIGSSNELTARMIESRIDRIAIGSSNGLTARTIESWIDRIAIGSSNRLTARTIEPEARSRRERGGMGGHVGAPHQNKKYRCAIGNTLAGSHVSTVPSARTW